MIILYLMAGAVLGGVVAWLLLKGRYGRDAAVLEERLRAAEAAGAQLAGREEEVSKLREELAAERASASVLSKSMGEKIKMLEEAEGRLCTQFENLANRIFDEKSSRFAGDSRQKLDELLRPFREQLGDFRKRVDDIYSQEGQQRATLLQEIKQLRDLNTLISKEANQLTTALKGDSKTRGNWGELIVERVFELSGLTEGREYESQKCLKDRHGGDQKRYPDFIVHLPEGRDVIIDAKMVLNDYARSSSAEEEQERAEALKAHVEAVRGRIKELSGKNYEDLAGVRPLSQVIMCIPSEPAYIEAVKADPGLYDYAFKQGIMLVGPNTLVLALKIVSVMWQADTQNRNAVAIAERGQRLYDKFVGFVEELEKVHSGIRAADSACIDAKKLLSQGSGNLVAQAGKLIELGVKAKKRLPDTVLDGESGSAVEP